MRGTFNLFLATIIILWASHNIAFAQDDAKERAKALSEKGQAAYEAGRFQEAAQAFEEANRLFPHPNILFNAAKAWEAAAEYEKAIQAYEGYLDLYQRQEGTEAPDKENVLRTIALLKEKAYLALPEVTIESDPEGSEVAVDDPDKVLGQTPITIHLPEGTHRIFLRKGGYVPIEKEFVVKSRQPLRLTFTLEKVRNLGGLRFHVNIRKARIYVDGKVQAVTPFNEVLEVEAGTHQVVVEKERYNQHSETVTVKTGETVDIHAKLYLTNPPFSWRGYLGITGGILGSALVATSALFLRKEANKYFEGTSDFKTYRNLTYIGYGVGGALIGCGVGLLVWEYTRKDVDREDLLGSRDLLPLTIGLSGSEVFIGAQRTF